MIAWFWLVPLGVACLLAGAFLTLLGMAYLIWRGPDEQ